MYSDSGGTLKLLQVLEVYLNEVITLTLFLKYD